MLVRKRRGWEMPERQATPEGVYLRRRELLAGAAAGIALAALPSGARAAGTDDLYPAKRNEAFTLDRPVTDQEMATTYNNFYEFGSSKSIVREAQKLPLRPWTLTIDGMVPKTLTLDIDDLIRKVGLEERLYRHRCVEAWSMAVPWTGFPLAALVKMAEPQAGAKYVRFETFKNPSVAPGQKQFWYPWPYVDGLTVAEASNDLAFMVTGIYGKPLPPQNGAPLRLALPWKYGFKSVKSVVKISFVAERPVGYWEALQSSEYGFWANVNPAVPHPRWSQGTERVLGSDKRVPTLIWNGYGEQVAEMYKGNDDKRLYM